MSESQKPTSSSDEIDLGALFSKIGNFFANLGASLMRLLARLKRVPFENKLLFISLIVVGIVGSFSYTIYREKLYSSSMILSSEYLTIGLVDNEIEKLNDLADEVDYKGLAKELHISNKLASKIVDFDAKAFVSEEEQLKNEMLKNQLKTFVPSEKGIDLNTLVNQITDRHTFIITVRVTSPAAISELETALINFFKNNDFVKKRIEVTKTNLTNKRQKLVQESQKLDSLKFVIFSNYQSMANQTRQGSNNVILSDRSVTNPIEIYNQDIIIYNEIQTIDRQLFLQNDFEVISGFTEFTSPSSAGPAKAIAIAILVAIGLGYLIIAVFKFNTYLEKFA
jgi:hypothetical protein